MTEDESLLVEASLIDAYPGSANEMDGNPHLNLVNKYISDNSELFFRNDNIGWTQSYSN